MFITRKLIEKVMQNIKDEEYRPEYRSYEELIKIFTVEKPINEDVEENKRLLYEIETLYKEIINKIKSGDYEEDEKNVTLKINDLTIHVNKTGFVDTASYEPSIKTINIFARNLSQVENDYQFKANLVHELTHYLSKDKTNNLKNYKNPPDTDDVDHPDWKPYLFQPYEFEANTVSIAKLMIDAVEQEIRYKLNDNRKLVTKSAIQRMVDKCIHQEVNERENIYFHFCYILTRDEVKLREFYNDIVETIFQFLHRNLKECWRQISFKSIIRECLEEIYNENN